MNDTTDTLDPSEKSEPTIDATGGSPDAELASSAPPSDKKTASADAGAGKHADAPEIPAPAVERAPKRSESTAHAPSPSAPSAHSVPSTPSARSSGASVFWILLSTLIALAALGLSGWQWFEARKHVSEGQLELENRLAAIEAAGKENQAALQALRDEARVLQSGKAALDARISALESRQAESKALQAALEDLRRGLAGGRDAQLLLEAKESVVFAAQQLQLSENTRGAILALESADARLADAAQFIGLRKLISRDIDRLRALPKIDRAGKSMRIENIVSALDTLPLAANARPDENPAPEDAIENLDVPFTSLDYWKSLGARAWKKLRSLVRIERIDRQEVVPLAPEQSLFLRENCKLRLLAARVALLSGDQRLFRHDIGEARNWIERYFNTKDKSVQAALETIQELSTEEISVELPSLEESLSAIERFKTTKGSEAAKGNEAARDGEAVKEGAGREGSGE
ncbi:MAG: uroporphyrinogen-III C-methyltransferase [Candidatus Accumulibacter sp.]|nr:uroporphyrinogen-III C-methyltransferase [Accumulibacter sp.]